MKTISLDLGSGPNPKNYFNADTVFGIDIREDIPNNILKADLAIEPIPFEDDFFDFVTAYDFIEHIPRLLYAPNRRYPFVEFMNEVYRVLKKGGKFYSFTPAFPYSAAFFDPTHLNVIAEETFPLYFDNVNKWASMYGFNGGFLVESQSWKPPHLISILVKPKD